MDKYEFHWITVNQYLKQRRNGNGIDTEFFGRPYAHSTRYFHKQGRSFGRLFHIRLKKPNIEPAIDIAAMHSLEHLIATYLRNDPVWKDEVVYWGPMGCLTGFYLILKGDRASEELYELLLRAFKSVENAQEVPGAAPVNCGNYLMHNLEMAKWYAKEFADYLEANAGNSDIFEYPKAERLVTDDGQNFYDS